jgi:hypothetical protein
MSREERWHRLLEVGNTLREEMQIPVENLQAHRDAVTESYTIFGMLACVEAIKENPNNLDKIEEFAKRRVDETLDRLDLLLGKDKLGKDTN